MIVSPTLEEFVELANQRRVISVHAKLLADDLTRWATGVPDRCPVPARRRLRRVDLRDLTVTEHPVLPVPEVAPTPVTTR